MATFEDLERTVEELRREVRRLKGEDTDLSQAAVDQIVDNGNEEMEMRMRQSGRSTNRGFAALAEEVREKSIENQNRLLRTTGGGRR